MKKNFLYLSLLLITLISCTSKEEDRYVEIEGKQQHILDIGKGKPVVVFITGQGVALESFDSVQHEIARITRTFSYDRAGLGKSEPLDTIRSLDNMVKELKEILVKENVNPPYVLVGHSLGCSISRYYYHRHSSDVIGMILIDPNHEDYIFQLINSRIGAARKSLDSLIHTANPKWSAGYRNELTYADNNNRLLKGITQPIDIPVTLFISTRWDPGLEKYGLFREDVEMNKDMLTQWLDGIPDSKLILTGKSGHFIHVHEPGLVINEIKDMVGRVR